MGFAFFGALTPVGALFVLYLYFGDFMEKNFNPDILEQMNKLANERLAKMSSIEKYDCVKQEKKRTYYWLGISCYIWIYGIFTGISAAETSPFLLFTTTASAIISIFMFLKLFKKDDKIALIRIRRKMIKKLNSDAKIKIDRNIAEKDFVLSKTVDFHSFIPSKLFVDNENKRFIYATSIYQSKKYNFSDIIDYEIYENGHSKVKGRAGSALVGGAFFGLTGLVAGSSMSRKSYEICNHLELIIRINDIDEPQISITFIDNANWNKSSPKYQEMIKHLQKNCSVVEYMMNARTVEQSSITTDQIKATVAETKSNKEQLIELKELLDDGLITKKDFEQKKKQILGL